MLKNQLPAAVLWDMDGTLVDSEHYWMKSERDLAAAHSREWSQQDGFDLIGMSLYDSSQVIKEKLDSSLHPHEIITRLTDGVREQLAVEVPWRPGAKELLLALREAGIKTALVTMSLHHMAQEVVDQIPFKAFDVIVGGDDVARGKPFPDPYLRAAELLGVDASDCVAIEDSNTGLRSAEAAGTKAIGVPNFIEIPHIPGRTIWPTLVGVTVDDLRNLF
ncbi:HAD family hydrolase [Rhodoluna limnophila]|uniref:HAD family hydrolase n=1 Tax=Rhodoluna limnophila TaxID=232537 RepID=UPI0011073A7A|nr:HAD family hydrolase [Rhodoluna limnophila]